MGLDFVETAPGVMTAAWTHPRYGREHSIAVIEGCDAWNTFIDGEWIARDLPSFEAAVAAAEKKLTPKTSSKIIRVVGVLLIAALLGAGAVAGSKLLPATSAGEIATVTEVEKHDTTASKNPAHNEKVVPTKTVRDLPLSRQPAPVRRDQPALQPSPHRL